MGEQGREKESMKHVCAGLLAHVDAGKTTLSEAMLYVSGRLRKLGRVDHRDAFLDTDAQERERGITIFSKQAILPLPSMEMTLLDTPGHVDFSSEMERTLQILDYAILVISGTDGVQSHTRTPVSYTHLAYQQSAFRVYEKSRKQRRMACGRACRKGGKTNL